MTYESEIKFTTQRDADDGLLGLLYALKKPVKTAFSSTKSATARFSAMGMSIRFRSWCEKHGLTGALKPNNFFFANNSDETTTFVKNEVKVEYGVKKEIIALFETAEAGNMFYSLISYGLRVLSLQDCPETEEYFCRKNLISFDEAVKIGWIPIYSEKRNKKVLESYRKGSWPSRSPLFTKEEFNILTHCAEPFFESLASIRDSYYEMLIANGWDYVSKLIRSKFAIRHELLAKFAACSTKRLQELRNITKSPNTKKKDCKPADLISLLSSRTQPLQTFVEEIKFIFKSSILSQAISSLKKHFGFFTCDNVMDQIMVRLNLSYIESKVYAEGKFKLNIKKIEVDNDYLKVIEAATKLCIKISNQSKVITNYINKYVAQETPESRGYFRLRLKNVAENFISNCKAIGDLKADPIIEDVLSAYSGKVSKSKVIYSAQQIFDDFITLCDKAGEYWTLKQDLDAGLLSEIKKVQSRWNEIAPF